MTVEQKLKKIKELSDRATPGPWFNTSFLMVHSDHPSEIGNVELNGIRDFW